MRDGWVETNLGEIADVIGGGTPSTTIPEYWDGKIVWLTPTEITSQDGKVVSDSIRKITDLGFKNSGAQLLPKDSVILTSRASVGYVALAGQDLCTNQGFQSLIPKQSVQPKFLMFWIQQNRSEFESRSAGSTFKEISKSNVKSIKLNLPPLSEQKRIVDLISSIDSYIEALQQQLESTKKSRKAVLRELLTAGGTGWEESTLGDLISHSIGGIWGEEQGGAEVDVPVYRQTEFSDSGILTTPAEAIRSVSKSQLKNRTLQEGDILIQKSAGTPNLPGRVVSVPNLNGEVATFSNFLNLLRPDTLKCIPRLAFLIFWDKHQDGRAFQYQRGTNIKNLNLPSYLLETILIPSAPDQKRIVELISTFDDFLAHTNHSISLFENLRSGLLSDLLSGNHEIPSTYEKLMSAI